MISLYACGQITHFQFPKTTKQCPVANCRLKFEKRSDCIAHYKDLHAQGSILCPICKKPIRAHRPLNFRAHYERIHPNQQVPYDFETDRVTTNGQVTSMNE